MVGRKVHVVCCNGLECYLFCRWYLFKCCSVHQVWSASGW